MILLQWILREHKKEHKQEEQTGDRALSHSYGRKKKDMKDAEKICLEEV